MTVAERLRQAGMAAERSALIPGQLKKKFGKVSSKIERKRNESFVDILDQFGEAIF